MDENLTNSGVRPATLRQAEHAPTTARVAIHHARAGDRERFSYPVEVLRWRPCHVIVSGVFGPEVAGRSPIFRPGDLSVEFYWSDRWWNVTAAYEPTTGALKGYYCNVAKPSRWRAEPEPIIMYTDLDLDLIVFPDGRIELHDEDEFVQYAAQYHYPARTIERARRTVDEIIARIERRAHPFRFESLPALRARLKIP
jgi:protein associated with RNAse G/E